MGDEFTGLLGWRNEIRCKVVVKREAIITVKNGRTVIARLDDVLRLARNDVVVEPYANPITLN